MKQLGANGRARLVALLAGVVMSVGGAAHADPFCEGRAYFVPATNDVRGACFAPCATQCGNSDLLVFSSSLSGNRCGCFCEPICPGQLATPPTLFCEGLVHDTCVRSSGCAWDRTSAACVYDNVDHYVAVPSAPFAATMNRRAAMRPMFDAPFCETVADGSVACTIRTWTHFLEQLEVVPGRTNIVSQLYAGSTIFAQNTFADLSTLAFVPPALSFHDVAYGPTPLPAYYRTGPALDLTWKVPAASLAAAQQAGPQLEIVTRVPDGSVGRSWVSCTEPEAFVQWVLGYRTTSSLASILSDPADIAGTCDRCGGNASIDQLPLSNLSSEMDVLRSVHRWGRPVSASSAPRAVLAPAFSSERELKLAALELRYTKEQINTAINVNRRLNDQFTVAVNALTANEWGNPTLNGALQHAKFAYQLRETIRETTAFYVSLQTAAGIDAFNRYIGVTQPPLPESDYRLAMFRTACAAPELCMRSVVRAQQAVLQGVVDLKTLLGSHLAQSPWLANVTAPAGTLPTDAWFQSTLKPLLLPELRRRRDEAAQRVLDMTRLSIYLDCRYRGTVPGWTEPFADTYAAVHTRFDDLMQYASLFAVKAPTPPAVDPSRPETRTARLEALWLEGAYHTIYTRRQARALRSTVQSWLNETTIAIAFTYATVGLATIDMENLLLRMGRFGQFLKRESVAQTISGIGMAAEGGVLAHALEVCARLLDVSEGEEDDAVLQSYWECTRAAQMAVAGGFFTGASVKLANRLGAEARLTENAAAYAPVAARSRVLWLGTRGYTQAAERRLAERILDAPGAPPAPFAPSDPTAVALLTQLESQMILSPTFSLEAAANERTLLVNALRAEVQAGLSPDRAQMLQNLVARRVPVYIEETWLDCAASDNPLRLWNNRDVEYFWHEAAHVFDYSLHLDGVRRVWAGQSYVGKPAHIFSEMTADLRSTNRDFDLALQRVKHFYGTDWARWTQAIPELNTMSSTQAYELFEKLVFHPMLKDASYYDVLALRNICDPTVDRVIRSVLGPQ